MLQITSAKITASPAVGGWVQVHDFSPNGLEGSENKGKLYVVVASKNDREGVEGVEIERKIVSGIREEYYINTPGRPFDALKNATQKIANEFSQPGEKLEIACIVYAGEFVYTSAYGGCKVLIGRDGSFASILESGEEVIAASGSPKDGDILISGSESFFEKVSINELSESLKDKNPQVAVEKITPLIYSGEESVTDGALILKFDQIKQDVMVPEESLEATEINNSSPIIQKKPDLKKKMLNFWNDFTKKLPKRNVYVKQGIQDEAISHSRKLTLSIGVILLLILAVSVGFGIRQKRVNNIKKEYQGLLIEATNQVEQAISLASTSPEESRNLFLDSENKLLEIQALNVKDPKIDELQKMIEDSRAAILGEYEANIELFLDLGLLSSGFNGEKISSSGGNVYILDKNGNKVVSIAIATKKSEVVAGPTVIENPLEMTSYEDEVFLLFSDGIYLVDTGKTKLIEKTWGGDAFIYAFAGNLYVLDKNGNAIYRYAGSGGNNFGSQQSWLSTSTNADFASALGWGMDGAIYVLYPNSRVLKYSQGSPQNFSLKGITPEIGNVDAFYADSDNQYLYLLDKAGKRVVVVDKDGKYRSQYIGEQVVEATALAVSEADKKIILLTGQKLLSIELKGI